MAEVCEGIGDALLLHFGTEVWVRGAISGLNRSSNGHAYFTLIDPDDAGSRPSAILSVALFARARFQVNALLRKAGAVRMEDGIEVSIGGSIEHYAPNGRVQLIMTMIDPTYTLGRLAQNREATLLRLEEAGLLRRNRLLPHPVLPLRIGLVTSSASAAEADFLDELSRTGIDFSVTLFDARVQGIEAPASLAAAIGLASDSNVDIVAVVRGGGAKTDLVAFDHYEVAAAIARCRRPVIVGVGHEIDRSIADEVAHASAKTPTAAAGWIIQQVASFDQRVATASDRLLRAAHNQLARARERHSSAQRRLARNATGVMTSAEMRSAQNSLRLSAATRQALAAHDHRLDRNHIRLGALDPAAVMARGWTITRDHTGAVVRSVSQTPNHTHLTTQTVDGIITSTVDRTTSSQEKDS